MIYPDDFDSLPLPGETGHDALSPEIKLCYRIYELEAEVNNGGFDQFFRNSSGAHTPDTVIALEAIGARHTAKILRDAISAGYPTGFPEDSSEHEDALQDDEATFGRLNVLDDEFYKYEDNLPGLVNDYLKGGA